MAIARKSTKPVGITNEAGRPEIVLEINGLTLSMAPPSTGDATTTSETAPPAPTE